MTERCMAIACGDSEPSHCTDPGGLCEAHAMLAFFGPSVPTQRILALVDKRHGRLN